VCYWRPQLICANAKFLKLILGNQFRQGFLDEASETHPGLSGVGGGSAGVQRTPKVLMFEKLSRIPDNLGKIARNLGKIPKNPGKNGAQHLQKNTIKTLFLEVTPKTGLHVLCTRKFVLKRRIKLFRQVWGNSGKNTSHPPKFPYCSTYA